MPRAVCGSVQIKLTTAFTFLAALFDDITISFLLRRFFLAGVSLALLHRSAETQKLPAACVSFLLRHAHVGGWNVLQVVCLQPGGYDVVIGFGSLLSVKPAPCSRRSVRSFHFQQDLLLTTRTLRHLVLVYPNVNCDDRAGAKAIKRNYRQEVAASAATNPQNGQCSFPLPPSRGLSALRFGEVWCRRF